MKALAGLLIAALIGLGIYWFYFARSAPGAPESHPVQTIDTTRARMDLLAMAQAEQTYFAEHGAYASLDVLVSSGGIPAERAQIAGYTVTVETSASGFTATARCETLPGQTCQNFAVDQTMNVHAIP